MTREVTDPEGITWSCTEAYSGLSDHAENHEKAQVKGSEDSYWVVCTPEGGAKSVRLQLEGKWETSYSEEALLSEIKSQQESE
ncbi:hypothetical protein NG798_13840 [Ancylothrix sp. C2]|uniref:hypothetical protein n=1 Tax=Ancylothrix sp. D3o TaxID=2953691 RepID=UPI0021BB6E11|nr:hypothetical protein [Ancylothrix sp. D3o]MCT7950876.1 hypothetical protein [Ancylothrix sp. D3o]